jgi:acyl-CoA synthetase (AMP-forming)/AMP-acid ligase II
MLDLLPSTSRLDDARSGASLTRQELVAVCAQRLQELRNAGLGRGQRIAICHRDSFAMLIDMFATWHLGAAVVPLSASLTMGERTRAAERYAVSLWISDEPLGAVPSLPPAATTTPANTSQLPPADTDLDAPALILSTSGTTAEPKGVVLTRRAVLARVALNIQHIGGSELERSLVMLPLHFGHGLIGNALTPLFAGGTLTLWTEPALDGLAGLGRLIDDRRITFLSSVPSMWRVALRVSPKPAAATLRRVHVGSEALPSDLWRSIADWAGSPVFNMYGISETANWIGGIDGESCGYETGSTGRAWGGTIRVIDDETGEFREQGRGEIAVATPGLMSKYWNDAESSAKVLAGGWFRTGDIGQLSDDGLRVIGRLKYQINRGGIKISAEEIDALLRSHEHVEDACAFALPDAIAGEVVAAAVVAKSPQLDVDALRQWCAGAIRPEAVPHRIAVLDTLPRSERGKVRRDAVKDLFLASKK